MNLQRVCSQRLVGNSETNKTKLEIIVDRLTMQAISQSLYMTTWSMWSLFLRYAVDPVVCQSDTFTNKPKLRFLMHCKYHSNRFISQCKTAPTLDRHPTIHKRTQCPY